MTRRGAIVLALAGCAWLVGATASAGVGARLPAQMPSPTTEARPAARPVSGSLTVESVTAPQLRALLRAQHGRLVLLNFWGTWCAPCLKEIPELLELEREFAGRGLVLIGVAMDEIASLDSLVRPFHARYFPAFRSYSRNEPDMDALASAVDPAWNEMLPTTYLIGRDGKVLGRIQGRKSLAQFRATITPLL